MNLERIIQEYPKKYQQFPRKIAPLNENMIIYGTFGVGKTLFLHNYLWEFSKANKGAYIDFKDWRFEPFAFSELAKFAIEKKLSHLAIDNAPDDICQIEGINIIASSKKAVQKPGFKTVYLTPLDFEEFVAFEKHGVKIEDDNALASVFGRFAQIGNIPQTLSYPEARRIELTQKSINCICQTPTEKEIFKALCAHQSHTISLMQIYTYLKQRTKISKDFLYATIKTWSRDNFIHLLSYEYSEKAPKKLYFCDFTIPSHMTLLRDFGRLFENAVYCELINESVFCADYLTFYIPDKNLGIITRPFDDTKILEARVKKVIGKIKPMGITKLEVVTMHASLEYELDGVEILIEPFWNWATRK